MKENEKTPYEFWKRRAPNLSFLRVWGCLAKVVIPEPKRKKIGPKTVDAIFLGYAHHSSSYRFLVTNSEISEIPNNTVIESRDATFFENIFPYKTRIPKTVSEIPSTSVRHSSNVDQKKEIESQGELRRSKRIKIDKNFGEEFCTFLVEGEPTTFEEAMTSIDAPFWKEAINSEIESIIQNNTWEIVDLPPGNKAIGCKWILKKKLKHDGSIDKYKARLVAKV